MEEKMGTRSKCCIWHFYCKMQFANHIVLIIALIIPQSTESHPPTPHVWNNEPESPGLSVTGSQAKSAFSVARFAFCPFLAVCPTARWVPCRENIYSSYSRVSCNWDRTQRKVTTHDATRSEFSRESGGAEYYYEIPEVLLGIMFACSIKCVIWEADGETNACLPWCYLYKDVLQLRSRNYTTWLLLFISPMNCKYIQIAIDSL